MPLIGCSFLVQKKLSDRTIIIHYDVIHDRPLIRNDDADEIFCNPYNNLHQREKGSKGKLLSEMKSRERERE